MRMFYYAHKNESGIYSFSDVKQHKHDQAHRYPVNALEGYTVIGKGGSLTILRGPQGQEVAADVKVAP